MEIQSISVHIRYSKPLADGSYKTVELAAEGTIAPGEDWHEAEVALYHELGETMKYVFSGPGSGKVKHGPEMPLSTPLRAGSQTAPSQPDPQEPDHFT
jgi:hypothetical protein